MKIVTDVSEVDERGGCDGDDKLRIVVGRQTAITVTPRMCAKLFVR